MRNENKSRGATLVEFALILPVLLLLIFGIINFGIAYLQYQTMTNAAREGARASAAPFEGTNPGTLPGLSAVEAKVCTFLAAGSIPCGTGRATVTVTQTVTTKIVNGITLHYTQVNVSAPYNFIALPFSPVTMTTHAVMRNENDGTP